MQLAPVSLIGQTDLVRGPLCFRNSSNVRGRRMTQSDILRIVLLEWLLKREETGATIHPNIAEFLGSDASLPNEDHIWRGILRQLRDEDLLTLQETLGFAGTSFSLTGHGRSEIERVLVRRADPARRAMAAREAIVRWLYEQPSKEAQDIQQFIGTTHSYYEGALFELADIDSALTYLKDRGLIDGIATWGAGLVRPRLTSEGVDCIEQYDGSLSAYLRSSQGQTSSHNVVFQGNVSGQVAWGNREVAQAMQSGPSADDLITILSAVVASIPTFDLEDSRKQELQATAQQVGEELKSQKPDKSRLSELLERVRVVLEGAATSALAASLQVSLRLAAEKLGISLGHN